MGKGIKGKNVFFLVSFCFLFRKRSFFRDIFLYFFD